MRTLLRAALGLALFTAFVLTAGCTSQNPESAEAKVWGYVASAKNAQLQVEETSAARDTLRVDSVVAPGPAWLVVHLEEDGKPGERVGLLHVDEGASSDLDVTLEGVEGERIIVALHADLGDEGEFDFDMMNKETSPDRPYFVEGKEVARVVTLVD